VRRFSGDRNSSFKDVAVSKGELHNRSKHYSWYEYQINDGIKAMQASGNVFVSKGEWMTAEISRSL
jgi:hypothetical protein